MSVVTIAYLKSRFETGDFPTEQDFIDLIDTLNSSGSLSGSESGIIAAGATQVTATLLTKFINRVDTVPVGSGVRAQDATVGYRQTVQNNGAEDLLFYPALGNNFLGQAVNDPITIASGNQATVYSYNSGELTLI